MNQSSAASPCSGLYWRSTPLAAARALRVKSRSSPSCILRPGKGFSGIAGDRDAAKAADELNGRATVRGRQFAGPPDSTRRSAGGLGKGNRPLGPVRRDKDERAASRRTTERVSSRT